MLKKLCFFALLFFCACSAKKEGDQALNRDLSLKRQEIFQEQQLIQLDNDSLEKEYELWKQDLEQKFPAKDPIIEEHQQSLEVFHRQLLEHQSQLNSFQDSLDRFTDEVEKHSLGRIDDETVKNEFNRLNSLSGKLNEAHKSLLEDHQTLKDAYDALLGEYAQKKNKK